MKKRILIAEDEVTLGELLRDFLDDHGYEVLLTKDGEECLSAYDKFKPDLLVLDIIMPKKDGFEVLEELSKKNGNSKQPPVIILTNLNNLDDIEKALNLGARTYLVKTDHQMDDIIKKIKEALGE